MAGNHHRNQPPQEIEILVDLRPIESQLIGFRVSAYVTVRWKGTKRPVSNTEVIVRYNGYPLKTLITDDSGQREFDYIFDHSFANKVIRLNFAVSGFSQRREESITFPEKMQEQKSKKPGITKDPMRLRLSYHERSPGQYLVWAQVLGFKAAALRKGTVVFKIRGESYLVETNKQGYANLEESIDLFEGEKVKVEATINEKDSGIQDKAYILLYYPESFPGPWAKEWFSTSRGKIGILRWCIYLFWILFILIVSNSTYDPLLLPVQTELSDQQKIDMMFVSGTGKNLQLPESEGQFPFKTMMWGIFFSSIVFLVSFIFNWKLFWGVIVRTYNKVSNHFKSEVADPFWERFFEWAKVIGNMREKTSGKEKESDDPASVKLPKDFYAKQIGLEIIGEMLAELATTFVPRLFRRTT